MGAPTNIASTVENTAKIDAMMISTAEITSSIRDTLQGLLRVYSCLLVFTHWHLEMEQQNKELAKTMAGSAEQRIRESQVS